MQIILPARSLCFTFLLWFSLPNSAEDIAPPPKKQTQKKQNQIYLKSDISAFTW